MKSGENGIILADLGCICDDFSLVEEVIFTFKADNGEVVQKVYPSDEVTFGNDLYVIFMYQQDTMKLMGGYQYEAQVVFNQGATSKTVTKVGYIEDTLYTKMLDNEYPATKRGKILKFNLVGDAIVVDINDEIKDELLRSAVEIFLTEHKEEFRGDPGKDGKDGISPTAKAIQGNNQVEVVVTDKDGTTSAVIKGYEHSAEFERLANQVRSDANVAADKATSANISADNANVSANRAKTAEDNAKGYANNASASAILAQTSASNASSSAISSSENASSAKTYRDNAKVSADNAKVSENSAKASATTARSDADRVGEQVAEVAGILYNSNILANEVKAINEDFEGKALDAIQNITTTEDMALSNIENARGNAVGAIEDKKDVVISDIDSKEQEFMASIPENYEEFKASIEAEFDQLVTIVGEPEEVDLATDEELQEVFTSVSNGKRVIASAITDKGVHTEPDATFQQMADNIEQITSGGGSFDIVSNIAAARDEIIKPLLLNYNCVDIASSTTLTCNLTSAVDGWCLATVTTRSDATYPSGWTLLKEIHINDSTDQRMAMLCKQVQEDEEISFTAIQSNSARIYINLLVLDCNGFETNDGTEIVKINADSTQNIMPKIYDKCVWCCSGVHWSSYYYWNIDGLVSIGIQPSDSPRQCNIIDFLDINSRTIKGGSSTNTAFSIDSVKIL